MSLGLWFFNWKTQNWPIPQTAPFSVNSFFSIRQQLANRLNDPNKQFWSDGELKLYIQDALRFWNCLTGDNKQTYALQVSPSTVWYDLQAIGSPRIATLTDQDLYSRITAALLEPMSSTATVVTKQFSQDDIVNAVQRKRDEFLFRTACTSTLESFAVNPSVATIALPQQIIQVRRAYWLPNMGTASPVFKGDEFVAAAYQQGATVTPGRPVTFSVGIELPLTLEMLPPPDRNGTLECLSLRSQGVLSPSGPTVLAIPSDFVQALIWGALSDLLVINLEAMDLERAAYAKQRYEEFVALMVAYPFVFGARVGGLSVYADAVETLDIYSPTWRTASASPSVVGLSGQNLVAYPVTKNATITLLLCANANIPVADSDNIQLGQEILDVILDEAQSVASFKMGGSEAAAAGALHGNIIRLAAQRNSKVRAMSCFREILFGRVQREEHFAPAETALQGGG